MPANNCSTQSDEQIKLDDELNRMQIDQLHRATLNFSNNSLETKKLCVTVETGVFTLIAGIYKDSPVRDWIPTLAIFGAIVPFLFYIVDAVLWFYQDSLREKMLKEENRIRTRHRLRNRPVHAKTTRKRVFKALFNGSQVMYFGLITIAAIIGLVSYLRGVLCA